MDSDFPDEGTVDYAYSGGGGRTERDVTGGAYTWYNGNSDESAGPGTEPGDGTLAKSYYANADVVGDDPDTDDYRYYFTDHLGSTRAVYDENKALVASYEYTPYGDMLTGSGPSDITHLYTGHEWDPVANLYYAPYRYYSPDSARWNPATRDAAIVMTNSGHGLKLCKNLVPTLIQGPHPAFEWRMVVR